MLPAVLYLLAVVVIQHSGSASHYLCLMLPHKCWYLLRLFRHLWKWSNHVLSHCVEGTSVLWHCTTPLSCYPIENYFTHVQISIKLSEFGMTVTLRKKKKRKKHDFKHIPTIAICFYCFTFFKTANKFYMNFMLDLNSVLSVKISCNLSWTYCLGRGQ